MYSTDYTAMKLAYEAKWWKLDDSLIPHRLYVENLLETVDKTDLVAEPLSEVLCMEDKVADWLCTAWDSKGLLPAMKAPTTVPLPGDSEDLRARLAVLGNAWMFAGMQQSNRTYLKGLTPQLFVDYASYLLGKWV